MGSPSTRPVIPTTGLAVVLVFHVVILNGVKNPRIGLCGCRCFCRCPFPQVRPQPKGAPSMPQLYRGTGGNVKPPPASVAIAVACSPSALPKHVVILSETKNPR